MPLKAPLTKGVQEVARRKGFQGYAKVLLKAFEEYVRLLKAFQKALRPFKSLITCFRKVCQRCYSRHSPQGSAAFLLAFPGLLGNPSNFNQVTLMKLLQMPSKSSLKGKRCLIKFPLRGVNLAGKLWASAHVIADTAVKWRTVQVLSDTAVSLTPMVACQINSPLENIF